MAFENLREYDRLSQVYSSFKAKIPDLEVGNPEFKALLKKNEQNKAKAVAEERKMYSKIFG